MQPNAVSREVQSEGVNASGTFGISVEDTAHIMGILRDTLYTDRVLAVLREYAANAWDANREAGKPDLPIIIHIPTAGDPTLTIRDNGLGLSDQDVFEVYTQYGKSTKRSSDLAVGMLGIGSKSAFAYSDTFTITSWHKGMKRIYVAVLDDSDLGVMQRLHEEPCAETETGIEIKVAVRPEDIWDFHRKARDLYSFFNPRPKINIELLPQREANVELHHGAIHESSGQWLAFMGCIPYRINIEQLQGIEAADELWMPLSKLSGVLNFSIGEVEISASREELKYSKKTKEVLASRFVELFEEYVQHSLKMLHDDSLSPWVKRLRLIGMGKMGLPIPPAAKGWVQASVSFKYEKVFPKDTPRTFVILRGTTETSSIQVSSDSQFVVKDDPRKIEGFNLNYYDYVVKPFKNVPLQKVRRDLSKLIKMSELTGIQVIDISSLPYSVIKANKGRIPNKKHNVRSFRFVHKGGNNKSDSWEIVDREPTDEDVFVLLDRFSPVGIDDFKHLYFRDVKLADFLGIPMPEVYGYKTSEKKPITNGDCKGTPYSVWRKSCFKDHMTPALWDFMSHHEWARLICKDGWSRSYRNPFQGKTTVGTATNVRDHLAKLLGENHPIVDLFYQHSRGVLVMEGLNHNTRYALPVLFDLLGGSKDQCAKKALKDIEERYPLLFRHANLQALWSPDQNYHTEEVTFVEASEWADYIKLVDSALGEKNEDAPLTSALQRVV